ncbi:MAG: hypothetical protein KF791_20510 [Verrucomicrobiae bacterium]|nr:hypothetical protein [Verrucomicrobiae bacterium]
MAWSAESVTGLWTSHPHLVAGIALILLYVLWPAFSVFRSFARFPALLAFVGALLIAATVWTQRTFPELARRVAATRDPGDRRGLPGPAWIPWIIVAAFLLLTVARASSR